SSTWQPPPARTGYCEPSTATDEASRVNPKKKVLISCRTWTDEWPFDGFEAAADPRAQLSDFTHSVNSGHSAVAFIVVRTPGMAGRGAGLAGSFPGDAWVRSMVNRQLTLKLEESLFRSRVGWWGRTAVRNLGDDRGLPVA